MALIVGLIVVLMGSGDTTSGIDVIKGRLALNALGGKIAALGQFLAPKL